MSVLGGAYGRPKTFWVTVVIAAVVTLAAVGLDVRYKPALLQRLEAELFDLHFRIRDVQAPNPNIALVVGDEQTAEKLGHWPFSHVYLATVIDRLAQDGAKVITFDIVFPQEETGIPPELRTTLQSIGQSLPADSPLASQVEAAARAAGPDDTMAASMKAAGNVILGFALDLGDQEIHGGKAPDYFDFWGYGTVKTDRLKGAANPVPEVIGILPPNEKLGRAASAAGFVNVKPDVDYGARYEMMALRLGDDYYPSLSLATAAAFLGRDPDGIALDLGVADSSVQVADRTIPVDPEGRLAVNYYGPPKTFPTFSMLDVIDGKFAPGTFKNKIVFIGVSLIAQHDLFK